MVKEIENQATNILCEIDVNVSPLLPLIESVKITPLMMR